MSLEIEFVIYHFHTGSMIDSFKTEEDAIRYLEEKQSNLYHPQTGNKYIIAKVVVIAEPTKEEVK